jgi:DNA-binding transcriptional regulator YdaS (Cro superfamily)
MDNVERKKLLPRGAQQRIAKRLKLWPSWVSAVMNTELTGERSPRVERAIVREIVKTHPEIDPAEVFPPRSASRRQIAISA